MWIAIAALISALALIYSKNMELKKANKDARYEKEISELEKEIIKLKKNIENCNSDKKDTYFLILNYIFDIEKLMFSHSIDENETVSNYLKITAPEQFQEK